MVSSVSWVEIQLISGLLSSSSLFSRVSIIVTVLFVFLTMSKIVFKVGSGSVAMLVLISVCEGVLLSGIVFAPALV